MRPSDGITSKQMIKGVEEMYNKLPIAIPEDNKIVKELYEMWLGGLDSDKCNSVLHTEYHAVEKPVNALNIKW